MHPLAHRHYVRDAIRRCTDCRLHSVGYNGPVPFSGPSPNTIAVIGEAPGEVEDRRGEPFVGPAGRMAREMLTDAGMEPESMTWMNAVCCWPRGTPTKEERLACHPHLSAQLAVVRPRWALVLGNVALLSTHPNPPPIGQARGLWYTLGAGSDHPERPGTRALATYHPAALLRNGKLRAVTESDLAYFALVIKEEVEPALAQFCCRCERLADAFMDDFPYCHKHYPREPKTDDVMLPGMETV